jgi:hypothetical protein
MKESGMSQTRSILYNKDGNPTEDEGAAVRGEVVEVDDAGNVIANASGTLLEGGPDLARR